MVLNGFDIDIRVRAAKARLKGQRAGVHELEAAQRLAELLALRELYRTTVHARFDLLVECQTSLATALSYVRLARGQASKRLRAQVREAARVRVELPTPEGFA